MLEGKGPPRWPESRVEKRLEEVAKELAAVNRTFGGRIGQPNVRRAEMCAETMYGLFNWAAKAVRGGYCGLQRPLKLALGVRETAAGHRLGALEEGGGGTPPCDIPSGCCFLTGPRTVTHSSLRMLRRVVAFCRPLRPVLLLVSFLRSRSPVVGVLGLCLMWQDVPLARQRRPVAPPSNSSLLLTVQSSR